MSAYSPTKALWHLDRIASLRRGEQIVPTQVQLIISDLCNQDCGFCAYRMSGYSSNQLFTLGTDLAAYGTNNPKRMIPFEKIVEILDDCAAMGVHAIQITGGGEPTVHPRHREVFRAVLDRGLDLALVTNGTVFRGAGPGDLPSTAELLSRAKWVRVSLDAGLPETYASIRRVSVSAFHAVVGNIQQLVAAKAAAGSGVTVGVGFVVTRENWREVVAAAWLARDLGADNIRISAVFQNDDEGYFADFYDDAAALCREAELLRTGDFEVYNNFGERVEDLRQRAPGHPFCGYQQFVTYVGADLNVYRCCVLAYNERGLIGSIKERSFRELWESQHKQDDFAGFDARDCSRCMFNGKLRAIADAIDPAPQHVNFV